MFVSHNLQAVAELCDRALYLANSVRKLGPTGEVIEAYVRTDYSALETQSADLNVIGLDLLDGDGVQAERVPAGSTLTLRVKKWRGAPLTDIEFGISVCRSTDGY